MAEPAQAERSLGGLLFERAPDIAAALAFAAGAIMLIAIEMPALPHVPGLAAVDRFVAEFPELSASVAGVALMGLAAGLRQRIDTAWALTTSLLGAIALYAIFRHEHVIAAALAGGAAVALALLRPAFFRHSRLSRLAPGRTLALAIAMILGAGLVAGLLWAGARPGFAAAPWWALFADPHLGRPGRILLAALIAFACLLIWTMLIARARGRPAPAASADMARVREMMARAENARPDAWLAEAGDKSFIFGDGAFVMAARGGASLIAMGGPVGAHAGWKSALAALRREAESLALRPVVYSAPPEALPDLLDLGFQIQKVGENAVVPLAEFSLAGKARQNLRTSRRRFVEREGAAFEVLEPPHDDRIWRDLQHASDAWLNAHGGKEKAFSLGRFDRAYLARQPIAIVRAHGALIAFANLWTTPDRTHAALDLMRYDPEKAPHGVMDFLFTEILLWARENGYRDFDLGMAPLAGLAEDEYAPLFARLGRLIYDRGEALYGFKGLRRYKEKFGPRWEPRYLAAPGVWTMPIVLGEIALLTSGGVGALAPQRRASQT